MVHGVPARMGGRHTHAPGAAVDVATLTLSHSQVHDHARAARMPRGTGPMDAERSEAPKKPLYAPDSSCEITCITALINARCVNAWG